VSTFNCKITSEESESQYNLIKTLLADPEIYKDAVNAIKKYSIYAHRAKKTCGRKYFLMNESQIALIMMVNF
jgi:hypothetical protein